MKKYSKTSECVYCGSVSMVTEDHIPPKNLFGKPRPGNLIKVPSCTKCHSENKQVSMDDEYFRMMLTLREDVSDHPDVKKILPTVMRSLARPDKEGFRMALLRNMHKVDLFSPSGLYLEKRSGYNVDLRRLDRVAARVTKGLFFHEKGRRLPDAYETVAYSESGMRDLGDDARTRLSKLLPSIMSKPLKTIGNDVFSYRVSYASNDENTSGWLMLFYGRVAFLSLTLSLH